VNLVSALVPMLLVLVSTKSGVVIFAGLTNALEIFETDVKEMLEEAVINGAKTAWNPPAVFKSTLGAVIASPGLAVISPSVFIVNVPPAELMPLRAVAPM